MTAAVIVAVPAIVALALLAWLAHLLRRDRGVLWHPGDPLPDIPQDAAIRHWHARAAEATGLPAMAQAPLTV